MLHYIIYILDATTGVGEISNLCWAFICLVQLGSRLKINYGPSKRETFSTLTQGRMSLFKETSVRFSKDPLCFNSGILRQTQLVAQNACFLFLFYILQILF